MAPRRPSEEGSREHRVTDRIVVAPRSRWGVEEQFCRGVEDFCKQIVQVIKAHGLAREGSEQGTEKV